MTWHALSQGGFGSTEETKGNFDPFGPDLVPPCRGSCLMEIPAGPL